MIERQRHVDELTQVDPVGTAGIVATVHRRGLVEVEAVDGAAVVPAWVSSGFVVAAQQDEIAGRDGKAGFLDEFPRGRVPGSEEESYEIER